MQQDARDLCAGFSDGQFGPSGAKGLDGAQERIRARQPGRARGIVGFNHG